MSRYFAEKEFRRCEPPCSEKDMDKLFLSLMDKIREDAGIPLVMTSAYRSVEWEKAKGRSGEGDHPQGCGVDFVANTSQTRMKIIKSALHNGIRRIGIGKNFVHIGYGKNLPQDVIWTYYE